MLRELRSLCLVRVARYASSAASNLVRGLNTSKNQIEQKKFPCLTLQCATTTSVRSGTTATGTRREPIRCANPTSRSRHELARNVASSGPTLTCESRARCLQREIERMRFRAEPAPDFRHISAIKCKFANAPVRSRTNRRTRLVRRSASRAASGGFPSTEAADRRRCSARSRMRIGPASSRSRVRSRTG